MNNNNLQIAYSDIDSKYVLDVIKQLKSEYHLTRIYSDPLNDDVILAIFTKFTKKDNFLSALPWLNKQLEYSSISHLKVMPFFIYDSQIDDPEEIFNGETGELYEDIFSTEFKPFGWDIIHPNLKEFKRVLETYRE